MWPPRCRVSSAPEDPRRNAGSGIDRLGDYYGPVVNVAARLAAVQETGEIAWSVGR
jgi:class 3 adenylate cyclase